MKSLDDIIKREAKFHMPRSLYEQLNVLRDVSPTSKHIVELVCGIQSSYINLFLPFHHNFINDLWPQMGNGGFTHGLRS